MSDTVISHTFTFLITNMLDNFYIYSDFSMRCIRLTTRGCRPYRLSLLGCRFGRSESSGFVGVFRLSSSSLIRLCTCAYRAHFTSRLEVSCRLWLALKSVFERNELFIWIQLLSRIIFHNFSIITICKRNIKYYIFYLIFIHLS